MVILLTLCILLGAGVAASAEDTAVQKADAQVTEDGSVPLVVAYGTFSQKFSPFYGESEHDMDVVYMVLGEGLLTTDRAGDIVHNAIKGETIPYAGVDHFYSGMADVSVDFDEAANITTYTAKLREGMKFSDGEPVTADDLIFSYYVMLDPSYVGSATISSCDIIGLKDYQTQIIGEIYGKYEAIANGILAAGRDHEWARSDAWIREQQDAFWTLADQRWVEVCQAIVRYVRDNYLIDEYATLIGSTAAAISDSEGLQIAYGMTLWGFGEIDAENATVFVTSDGKVFDFAEGEYPTIVDFYDATFAVYAGDGEKFSATEHPDQDASYINGGACDLFIVQESVKDPCMTGGVPNIAGIQKLDALTVQMRTHGFSAPAVYSILNVQVAPKHYYGDGTYDYCENNFGHPFGDLACVEAKTTAPMGAGPYKFVKYENEVVYFEANEHYYKGEPKIKHMRWRETPQPDKVHAVASGTADISDASFSKTVAETVASYNTSGQLSGDKIVTSLVDNLGYGYIGLNADTVRVGSDSASQKSKYLRAGLATVIAALREEAVNSYYGPSASVIDYPISNASWAAPRKTDDGYKQAFSAAIDGSDIFSEDMDASAKKSAALAAAVEYFKAAGYSFDEVTGKFTAAPAGAKLAYEIILPANSVGDHPCFGILTEAKKQLGTIGITLNINDPADPNVLWDRLKAGTQEMWCAAWQATIDPDMYRMYHASGIVGKGGSDRNYYYIADPALDEYLWNARVSHDQGYRKAVYKSAMEVVIDWAVEIPIYQRQDAYLFSPERVNIDTLTKDLTTFYKWSREIEKLELNQSR